MSPFFTGGWWTSGVGSEKARPTDGDEPADTEAEGEEKDSEFRVKRAAAVVAEAGFEAEQPMKKEKQKETELFLSLETICSLFELTFEFLSPILEWFLEREREREMEFGERE